MNKNGNRGKNVGIKGRTRKRHEKRKYNQCTLGGTRFYIIININDTGNYNTEYTPYFRSALYEIKFPDYAKKGNRFFR